MQTQWKQRPQKDVEMEKKNKDKYYEEEKKMN